MNNTIKLQFDWLSVLRTVKYLFTQHSSFLKVYNADIYTFSRQRFNEFRAEIFCFSCPKKLIRFFIGCLVQTGEEKPSFPKRSWTVGDFDVLFNKKSIIKLLLLQSFSAYWHRTFLTTLRAEFGIANNASLSNKRKKLYVR